MLNPVKVTDVTLRDGQEDFVQKYLHQEDLARLGAVLDRAGFYSIDCWGGNTFYAALTERKEDPWEWLKKMRRVLSHTPLQMVIRGRMLVGFKPYSDEMVRKFMTRAAALGVDIFRIYDSLNDLENMEVAITTGKELRKQVEATALFSLNPHVTDDDYLTLAGGLINLGADVICINDSFGAMTPHQVATLVSAYRRYFHQPLRLHLHDNRQSAVASYQEGVHRGVELVDTTMAALSWPYGPPPLESLMFSLGGTVHDPHIDLDILGEVAEYVDQLKEKYRYREPAPRKLEDRLGPTYLPGLLKEFIREELIRRDARDRQQAAFKEAQQVWGDLGYPALKGRILDIVGLQAVENILSARRYDRLIPSMQDLLRGKYGRLHSPVLVELQWRALAGEEEAAVPATPEGEGQLLPRPDLGEEDLLTYSLFPEEAEAFFYLRSASAAPPSPRPAPAATPSGAYPILAPLSAPLLTLAHKGEEVRARLQGVGSIHRGKQALFINIQDQVEEVEVQMAPGSDGGDYLVTFHGETYRIRIGRAAPKEQEYTPVSLEINGQTEEFLFKE